MRHHAVMTILAEQLAQKIRELRGEKTQRDFARPLGISHATINRIEQCKENVTLATLQNLCDGLKCEIGDLFAPIKGKKS